MTRVYTSVAVFALWLSACGPAEAPPSDLELRLPTPWTAAALASCGQHAQVWESLSAILTIGGGFDDTQLTVDAVKFTVSGAMQGVVVGTVRPLLVSYAYNRPGGTSIPLGYYIGAVDLCSSVPDTDHAVVTFALGDVATSAFVYKEGDFGALPSVAPPPSASTTGPGACAVDLTAAKAWAKEEINKRRQVDRLSLDVNCNALSNLEEACAGTLLSNIPGSPCS